MNPLIPLAIFLGSALLFFLQPMVGRTLLPSFGGSAAVWSVCLATFQVLLVGGYFYAHVLGGMGARKQRRLHVALLALGVVWAFVIALVALPLARAKLHAGAAPSLEVLLVVLLSVGVPYLVLSAGSSLLQAWVGAHAGLKGRAVYWLYAVSNLGSFIGLFMYPFVMEPFVPLHWQWIGWSAALAAYLALVAGIALQSSWHGLPAREPGESGTGCQPVSQDAQSGPPPVPAHATPHLPWPLNGSAWWYVLPGISSFMLVSTTNHLSMDVAPVPLLWAVLLGAFLLSYVAGFSRLGERGLPVWRVLALCALLWSGVMAGNEGGDSFLPSVAAGTAFVFFGSTFLHGWLYSIRPEGARLTRFYLGLAVGGAAGGMLVSFVAPLVFSGIWEYPVALFICALAGIIFSAFSWLRQHGSRALDWFAVAACVVAILAGFKPFLNYLMIWFLVHIPAPGITLATPWGAMEIPYVALVLGAGALGALIFAGDAWRRSQMPRLFNAVVAIACVGACLPVMEAIGNQGRDIVYRARNFYGSLKIEQEITSLTGDNARVFSLTNGGTMHGIQVRYDAGEEGRFADTATSYYSPHGGGLSFAFSPKWRGFMPKKLMLRDLSQFQRPEGKPMRVAVIGLGTGSMVAWGRKGDDWTFYEINPLVDQVARDDRFFTYLKDSNARHAKVDTALGDARLLLERERKENAPVYDVIVADAYTGDSLPMQLATKEAFLLYRDRLAPDGVLVIHISNWHLNLLPLCKAVARELGMHAVGVMSDGNPGDLTESTLWVFLTKHQVKVDATGSGATLVDFTKVDEIRLPTDTWGGLQSLISFKFNIRYWNRWHEWKNLITLDVDTDAWVLADDEIADGKIDAKPAPKPARAGK